MFLNTYPFYDGCDLFAYDKSVYTDTTVYLILGSLTRAGFSMAYGSKKRFRPDT